MPDIDQVQWLVREYGESAALAAEGGADALELHANHDDVLAVVPSPLDEPSHRRLWRQLREPTATAPRGRRVDARTRDPPDHDRVAAVHGRAHRWRSDRRRLPTLVEAFTADGTVDYFSLDVGDNWGRVSYIQPGFYDEGEWAPLAGRVRSATNLPVVYVGRVTSVETAERILAEGHA